MATTSQAGIVFKQNKRIPFLPKGHRDDIPLRGWYGYRKEDSGRLDQAQLVVPLRG